MQNRLTVSNWKSDTAFTLNPQMRFGSGLRGFSAACLQKLHALKESINADLTHRFAGIVRPEILRQAVNEADALALSTGFPTLFLPTLAEEKAQLAARWETRQQLIRDRSLLLAA